MFFKCTVLDKIASKIDHTVNNILFLGQTYVFNLQRIITIPIQVSLWLKSITVSSVNGVGSKKSCLLKELSNCVKWMSVIDQGNGGFLCHFEGIRTTLLTVYLWWCNTRNLKPANGSITKPLVLRRFPLPYFSLSSSIVLVFL